MSGNNQEMRREWDWEMNRSRSKLMLYVCTSQSQSMCEWKTVFMDNSLLELALQFSYFSRGLRSGSAQLGGSF